MEIKNFKYSLIIPTRNRQSTAISAIESGLNCSYPNLEIVVSDNSDDDSLREILFKKQILSKINYSKTPRVLSMRDNWERGVELSSGEYLSIIGDDDAVLPDAFLRANIIFSHYDVEILKSSYAIYKWPDYPFHGMRNFLDIPLDDEIRMVKDPQKLLIEALQYKQIIGTGPGIYYGFVKRTFLERLKKMRGRYFVDVMVDFDSGYATLMYAKSYLYSSRIMFIAGHSGASNSGAMRLTASLNTAVDRFIEESIESNESVFTGNLESLKTPGTAILSAQMRMLPEIRNAIKDSSICIDMHRAWNYLAKEISQGYDGINFLQEVKQLEQLAREWNIKERIKLPIEKNLSWGILYEQGPRLKINDLTSKEKKAPEEKRKLVVNGNKLNFVNILDAVRYVDATLSQLARFESADALNYYNKLINDRSNNSIKLTEAYLLVQNYDDAESILNKALVEDSRNPILLALIGKIYLEKKRFLEGANAWARALSFSPNGEYLKCYLLCLLGLGRSIDARKYLEFCIVQNPEHAVFFKKIENELFEKD